MSSEILLIKILYFRYEVWQLSIRKIFSLALWLHCEPANTRRFLFTPSLITLWSSAVNCAIYQFLVYCVFDYRVLWYLWDNSEALGTQRLNCQYCVLHWSAETSCLTACDTIHHTFVYHSLHWFTYWCLPHLSYISRIMLTQFPLLCFTVPFLMCSTVPLLVCSTFSLLVCFKLRIHERAKWFANGSQTKYAYVWTGLWTCAAPSANGSHTVCQEPKIWLSVFYTNTKRTGCAGCPSLASGSQKIN